MNWNEPDATADLFGTHLKSEFEYIIDFLRKKTVFLFILSSSLFKFHTENVFFNKTLKKHVT